MLKLHNEMLKNNGYDLTTSGVLESLYIKALKR